jgi:hypothetical protein
VISLAQFWHSAERFAAMSSDLKRGIKLPIKRAIVGPSAHQASNAAMARDRVGTNRVPLSQSPPALLNTG